MIRKMLTPYKSTFIELFSELKRLEKAPLQNSDACFWIQDSLIRSIKALEARIQTANRMIARKTRLLKMKRAILLTKEEAAVLKETIRKLRNFVEHYQYVLYVLRTVADGLAFIYFPPGEIVPMAIYRNPDSSRGKRVSKSKSKCLGRFSKAAQLEY